MPSLTDIVRQSTRLEPQSKSAYLLCVQRFEAFAKDPRSWTPQTVERWRDSLLAAKKSPQTVNKHIYALRYATKRREALGQGPDFARAAEGAKTYRVKKRSALTIDDVERILATCAGKDRRALRDRALITIDVRTGLRVSELRQLRWDGIKGRQASVKAKGGHVHVTVLDDDCLAALEAWKKALPPGGRSGFVFVGLLASVGPDALPTTHPLSRQAIHRIMADRGKEAGIKKPIHPHLLRHTFVTWCLEAGVPVQRVMVMTGHKSLATLSGYVSDLQAESDPVGSYLPKLGGKK